MRGHRCFGIALVAAFSFAECVSAATISVDATNDVLADDGVCTLREAVIAANTDAASGATAGECDAGSGADVIELPAGIHTLAIAGREEDAAATGDLDLSADVQLEGVDVSETIIDGADLDRVFHVLSGVVAEIRDVTIQNGFHDFRGGGIQNQGTLTVRRAALSLNVASGGLSEPIGSGAGIHNASGAALTLEDSTLIGNSAEVRGGGIYNQGALVLRNSSLVQNTASRALALGGGGLAHEGSSATLSNCTFSGNRSNSARPAPGAILIGPGLPLSLTHCTLSGNISIFAVADGILGGAITLANVILDDGCYAGTSATSLGGNVETAGSTCGLTDPSDQVNVAAADLALGALADNGGPTQTHAIGAASVARDTALAASCTETDQRGVLRPDGDGAAGGACDAGAFEFECAIDPDLCEEPPPPPPPLAVEIDVRPGNERNRIRLDRGSIRVAILGASAFAVAEIDVPTLGFGPNASIPQHDPQLKDVNKDGQLDLVVRFENDASGLVAGDTEACVVGMLIDGSEFEGCDGVTIVVK